MSWMSFTEYVLIEHAVNDRLQELRRTAEWRPFPLARPSERVGLQIFPISLSSVTGARRFSHALVGALGALGILAVAATVLV